MDIVVRCPVITMSRSVGNARRQDQQAQQQPNNQLTERMNKMSDVDPFQFSAGLKSDYEGDILDAHFATGENNDDVWYLWLKVLADDGEEVLNRYGVGGGWVSYDGGETVEHPTSKYFNKNSAVALLVTHAFDTGAEEALRERSAGLDNKGPKAAALWPGLRFYWEAHSETFKMKDRDTGEMIERERVTILPTKYLGVVGVEGSEGEKAQPPAQPNQPAQPAQPAANTHDLSTMGLEPAQVTKIKIAAKTMTYSDFVDECLTVAPENSKLVDVLGDEDFYTSLRK